MRRYIVIFNVFLFIAIIINQGDTTCVFESDFGFKLNCAFKQSGIFRVRNLGGVKGYLGLGLSVGDELGFPQSLSNVEGNKRRSTSGGTIAALAAENKDIPEFKPVHPEMPVLSVNPPSSKSNRRTASETVPPFKSLPSSVAKLSPSPPSNVNVGKLSGVRAQTAFRNAIKTVNHQFIVKPPQRRVDDQGNNIQDEEIAIVTAIPSSYGNKTMESELDEKIKALANASNLSIETIKAALNKNKNTAEQLQQASAAVAMLTAQQHQAQPLVQVSPVYVPKKPTTTTTTTTSTTTTTTQRSINVAKRPTSVSQKLLLNTAPVVMNAPKEYYPVSYEKNYDDGFKSRVPLPPTNFDCGEQKHFPGLYADEDLGCMVFHVCAITDNGLTQKSFLCPENTLFDQSILKCNWWFYVDCTSSKKLYDSNIPVSKSYQLMKALAFFNSMGNKTPISS